MVTDRRRFLFEILFPHGCVFAEGGFLLRDFADVVELLLRSSGTISFVLFVLLLKNERLSKETYVSLPFNCQNSACIFPCNLLVFLKDRCSSFARYIEILC